MGGGRRASGVDFRRRGRAPFAVPRPASVARQRRVGGTVPQDAGAGQPVVVGRAGGVAGGLRRLLRRANEAPEGRLAVAQREDVASDAGKSRRGWRDRCSVVEAERASMEENPTPYL